LGEEDRAAERRGKNLVKAGNTGKRDSEGPSRSPSGERGVLPGQRKKGGEGCNGNVTR